MLPPRIYLSAILLLICSLGIRGQVTPKAILVDEFGLIVCGHLTARTDSLAEELRREPDTRAFIVVHPPAIRSELTTRRQLRLISSTLQLRGLRQDRFSLYKGQPSVDGQIPTQFWKLPRG